MEVFKEFTFDSAHKLPNVPEDHKCGKIHGHTFIVRIYVKGYPDKFTGWIMDFSEIKKIVQPIINELDHKYLNDIPGLENPTSEILAIWIWNRISKDIPQLSKVVIQETPNSGVVYEGDLN